MNLATPKRFILKTDTECNITDKKRVEVEDLSFDVVEGKVYKVSVFHLFKKSPKDRDFANARAARVRPKNQDDLSQGMEAIDNEEYDETINGKQLSYSFLSSNSDTNGTIRSGNEDWFENKLKFTNSYYNNQSIEKQFIIKAKVT